MTPLDKLKTAAVSWAQAPTGAEHYREALLLDAAPAYASIAEDDVAPGDDPTPAALAREVLSAAEKALTSRPWTVKNYGTGCDVIGTNHDGDLVVLAGVNIGDDATFIVTACNAAEALSRAVIEGEERERAARQRIGELEAKHGPGKCAAFRGRTVRPEIVLEEDPPLRDVDAERMAADIERRRGER